VIFLETCELERHASRYAIGRSTILYAGNTAMPIRVIQGTSFDAETVLLLGLAYERACQSVASDVTVREVLAKRILEAARRGERNVEKLIAYGLGRNSGLAQACEGPPSLSSCEPAYAP
jgi:hypothetical protein